MALWEHSLLRRDYSSPVLRLDIGGFTPREVVELYGVDPEWLRGVVGHALDADAPFSSARSIEWPTDRYAREPGQARTIVPPPQGRGADTRPAKLHHPVSTHRSFDHVTRALGAGRATATHFAVRLATANDVEELHALLQMHSYDQARLAGRLHEGWLRKLLPVDQLRFLIAHACQFWVARDQDTQDKIVGCACISPPTLMGRDRREHALVGRHAARVQDLLQRGQFAYLGMAATHPDYQRRGVMHTLHDRIVEHYDSTPLAAHIGIFSQDDFDRSGGDLDRVEPTAMNVASIRFFHDRGWEMAGYTSSIKGDPRNTSRTPSLDEPPYLSGGLFIRFPSATVTRSPVTDPMKSIRGLPDIPPTVGNDRDHTWELPLPPLELGYLRQQRDYRGDPCANFAWEREYFLRPPPEGYQPDHVDLPDAMQWELITIATSRAERTMMSKLYKLDPYALTIHAPFGDFGLIPRIGDRLTPSELRSMNEKRVKLLADWQLEVRRRCPPWAQRST